MKTYVCGHRNPDIDSVMSAFALADLRRRTGMADVEAISAGRIPDKAKWVFEHFGLEPPRVKRDVYVRVRHLMDRSVPMLDEDASLVDSLRALEASGQSSLPVRGKDGQFRGMLSPAKLLNFFLTKGDVTIPTGRAPLHHCTLVLNESDPIHDIRSGAIRNSHNHFPVVDEEGRLLGTVLKSAFAQEPPFRIILVDHNETDQGIPGLDEVPVIEVVDHHRIAFAATKEPIRYTADVVGSTCTLVARMYRAAGERPTREIAGVLIAGIVSDTLLFQSPTTTDIDRSLCSWLEKLCGESAESIMEGMSSVGSALQSMTPDQALLSDAKTYNEAGRKFVLAQIEETNMAVFHRHLGELTAAMDRQIGANALDFMALMVTDPVRGNSELVFRGLESVRRALPYRRGNAETFLMPGVLSRKKQLLHEIIAALA